MKPSCAVMKLMLCCGPRPPRHFLPPLLPHQSPVLKAHPAPQPVCWEGSTLHIEKGYNLASIRAVTAVAGRLSNMLCSPHASTSKSGALPFQVNTTAVEKDSSRTSHHRAARQRRCWVSHRQRRRKPVPRGPRCPLLKPGGKNPQGRQSGGGNWGGKDSPSPGCSAA